MNRGDINLTHENKLLEFTVKIFINGNLGQIRIGNISFHSVQYSIQSQSGLTVLPYRVMSLLRDNAVSEVVTVAVKMEMMTRPTNTQKKAKTLAMKDLGARSP